MRFLKKTWLPFLALLGIALAIIVPLFLRIYTDGSSSDQEITLAVGFAALVSGGTCVFVILGFYSFTKTVPRLIKWGIAWVVIKAVTRAIAGQTVTVEWTGITLVGDDIGAGLAIGSSDGVLNGHQFVVLNVADREKWGILKVSEVSDSNCVCSVFDRINPEFWAELERRMRSDPSPPSGVIIRREVPEENLLDWLEVLLRTWRD